MTEATKKEVKRGYVKWTDEDGVFHKEPLVDHPELLEDASPEEQLIAEEVRRLNGQAEVEVMEAEEDNDQDLLDTLHALQGAPEDVLTAAQLTDEPEAPAAAPEDPHAPREVTELKPTENNEG